MPDIQDERFNPDVPTIRWDGQDRPEEDCPNVYTTDPEFGWADVKAAMGLPSPAP